MSTPLRVRLLASFLLMVALTGCLITVVGVHLVNRFVTRQSQTKNARDLDMAVTVYNARLAEIRTALAFTGIRPVTVVKALIEGDRSVLAESLAKVRLDSNLDVLSIADAEGKVMLRTGSPARGDDMSADAMVMEVLRTAEPAAATHAWDRHVLELECPGLLAEPGSRAGDGADAGEHRFIVMAAAAPVVNAEGKLVGVLYGGNVLSRKAGSRAGFFVKAMRERIYGAGSVRGEVMLLSGEQLLCGSMPSDQGYGPLAAPDGGSGVEQRWLIGQERYAGVVKPLRDVRGEQTAALQVGEPVDAYRQVRLRTMLVLSLVTLAGMGLAAGLSVALAARILRPLQELTKAVDQVGSGNLDYRIKVDSRSPLAHVAETFNRMADSIKERDEQIKEDAHAMMESRRLATLGQLSAGVAHEINNPLGGITVYAHLLQEDVGQNDPRAENVRKIIREAERCKKIVKALLDYARQGGAHKEVVDINSVLSAAVSLTTQQQAFANVSVRKELAADLPPVKVDVSQLEEVFINVLVNAAEVMKGRGEILIHTGTPSDRSAVTVRVSDTGPGIPPENLNLIFEPFFTSKEVGHGTGLGLAISYGIVENHGGTIRAENNPGAGASFVIELPPAEAAG